MAASKIPVWIKQCLDQYGNCACGRAITKKIGKENLLQILENEGYPCELEILSDQKDKSAYPKAPPLKAPEASDPIAQAHKLPCPA